MIAHLAKDIIAYQNLTMYCVVIAVLYQGERNDVLKSLEHSSHSAANQLGHYKTQLGVRCKI